MQCDQKVLDSLPPLASGKHDDNSKEVCAMEALARACGLGTTDHPECASVVIGAFTRSLNDSLPDNAARDRIIRPLLPLMVGTADDGHDEERMWILADSAVRVFAANALEHADLEGDAKTLRVLAPICDKLSAELAAESAAKLASKLTTWSAARLATKLAAASAPAAEVVAELVAESVLAAWSMGKSAAWSMGKSAAWSMGNEQAIIDMLRQICEIGG